MRVESAESSHASGSETRSCEQQIRVRWKIDRPFNPMICEVGISIDRYLPSLCPRCHCVLYVALQARHQQAGNELQRTNQPCRRAPSRIEEEGVSGFAVFGKGPQCPWGTAWKWRSLLCIRRYESAGSKFRLHHALSVPQESSKKRRLPSGLP